MAGPEAALERKLVAKEEARGGECWKFTSPGRAGVPDRIILRPVPPEHQEIVARYVRFAEVKAPGQKPRPLQVRYITRLRELGYQADVIDKEGQL